MNSINNKKFFSTRSIVIAAMFVAMAVVLSYVKIDISATSRISLKYVPVLLSGMWIGPVWGGIIGGLSDVIAATLQYGGPTPLLSIAPILTGVLPGLFALVRVDCNREWKSILRVVLIVVLTNAVASVLVGSWAQSVISGTPFGPMLISRVPGIVTRTVPEIVLVYILNKMEKLTYSRFDSPTDAPKSKQAAANQNRN